MKIITTLLFSLFISTAILAQNGYQPGHYLNSANQKISGLIKNEDWKSNPSSIQFKASTQSERQTISLAQMNGFSVNGGDTYIKKTFDLDVSTNNLNNLTYSKEPVFETRTALLNLLVTGTANLFLYEKKGIKEYFYTKQGEQLIPLIHVRYLVGNQVTSNDAFKQELLNAFNDCNELAQKDFVNLAYKRNSLVKIFDKYNACSDENYAKDIQRSQKTLFNLNVFAGANFSSIELTTSPSPTLLGDYGSSTAARFGLELEAILPFNNNRWAVYMGIAKNTSFESTVTKDLLSINTPTVDVTLTYSSLNVPLGARYYIPISEQVQLALQLGYMFDIVSEISLKREIGSTFENSNASKGAVVVGAGIHYKRFYGQATLDLGKDPFKNNSLFYAADVSSFNLVIGYQIGLNKK